MATILVGTDFSQSSREALTQARRMAEGLGAEIHLLHVVEPVDEAGSTDPETAEFYETLRQKSEPKMAQEVALLRPCRVETSVRVGPRHQTILQVADELEADLIVLGSHPISPESKRIGTSHRVGVTARRPVLLVPSDESV